MANQEKAGRVFRIRSEKKEKENAKSILDGKSDDVKNLGIILVELFKSEISTSGNFSILFKFKQSFRGLQSQRVRLTRETYSRLLKSLHTTS
jgi:hypothetical protein